MAWANARQILLGLAETASEASRFRQSKQESWEG